MMQEKIRHNSPASGAREHTHQRAKSRGYQMVNERPNGETDAHVGRSGALTGVRHKDREFSTRGDFGTDTARCNSYGTSQLQDDRMECSEASAAQLHGGGGGDGGGGGGGAEQEAGRRGAGCEGLSETAAVVTTRNEDVQLGEFDGVDDERDDGSHGVGVRGIAAGDARDAGGLDEERLLREGLHARLEQEPQPAGLDTGGQLYVTGGHLALDQSDGTAESDSEVLRVLTTWQASMAAWDDAKDAGEAARLLAFAAAALQGCQAMDSLLGVAGARTRLMTAVLQCVVRAAEAVRIAARRVADALAALAAASVASHSAAQRALLREHQAAMGAMNRLSDARDLFTDEFIAWANDFAAHREAGQKDNSRDSLGCSEVVTPRLPGLPLSCAYVASALRTLRAILVVCVARHAR
jgi:hypothetical protein